jgi:hypothetical protein
MSDGIKRWIAVEVCLGAVIAIAAILAVMADSQ